MMFMTGIDDDSDWRMVKNGRLSIEMFIGRLGVARWIVPQ